MAKRIRRTHDAYAEISTILTMHLEEGAEDEKEEAEDRRDFHQASVIFTKGITKIFYDGLRLQARLPDDHAVTKAHRAAWESLKGLPTPDWPSSMDEVKKMDKVSDDAWATQSAFIAACRALVGSRLPTSTERVT